MKYFETLTSKKSAFVFLILVILGLSSACYGSLEEDAENGDIDAQYNLAKLYQAEGKEDLGNKWFETALENGHSQAQFDMGYWYLYADESRTNMIRGVELYIKSAEQENHMAQHDLGMLYLLGIAVEQDNNVAFTWFKRAAEAGFAKSQTNVGNAYFDGVGVEQDLNQAFRWYEMAAKQGEAVAQTQIGHYYYEGWGNIKKSLSKAKRWYGKAAEQEDPEALYALGWMYISGEGAIQNIKKGKKLLQKSATLGFDAQEDLKHIRNTQIKYWLKWTGTQLKWVGTKALFYSIPTIAGIIVYKVRHGRPHRD
jgi:uncharacterized protein